MISQAAGCIDKTLNLLPCSHRDSTLMSPPYNAPPAILLICLKREFFFDLDYCVSFDAEVVDYFTIFHTRFATLPNRLTSKDV